MRISTIDAQVENVENPGEKSENWKNRQMKIKHEFHEIESNPSKEWSMPEEDNPSFWDELSKLTFFVTV
jgi:hypothetical protein